MQILHSAQSAFTEVSKIKDTTIGAIIHPHELSQFWIEQAKNAKLDVLGLHPVGGVNADETLKSAIGTVADNSFKQMLDELRASGIAIEYEMHALSYMVPHTKEVFSLHPEWFRMNENGERANDYNVCASNLEVLELITQKSRELAEIFPSDTHLYHFWIDDVENACCHCPKCREFSPSDQALMIYNAIAEGVKQADPLGKQCYLAYHEALKAPEKIPPANNIFLEYAPIGRDLTRPINDADCEKNVREVSPLDGLLEFFGCENTKVLEYWLDNSLLSNWRQPIQPFTLTPEIIKQDVAFYHSLGIKNITTFACYLGEEYVQQNGDVPDITGYTAAARVSQDSNVAIVK